MDRTPEHIQDELLVFQCQDGDGEALKTLIGRWQPKLLRFAWRLTAQRDAAQDIVQDAWLTIVRGINKLDDPARFQSWAYRIVKNKCVDWTRRRVVQRKAILRLEDNARATNCDNHDAPYGSEISDLRSALAKLPFDQRAILSLHYLDAMGIAEIAHVLDVPKGTIKSRLYHARLQLKQTLERIRS